jgi:hypothetical protein
MEFQLDRTLEILRCTPATLRSLLSGLSDAWIRNDEGPETWSAFDILGHLIHGEETDWILRLIIILEHGESRPFTPFDRFAQFEKSAGVNLGDLLDEFQSLRRQNISELERLDLEPHQLEMKGTHPELGTVTARQLLATWTVHDLGHIAQITRVLAKGYAGEVGPWGEYLPILKK